MTPTLYNDLLKMLRKKEQTLPQVIEYVKEAGSNWSEAQIKLFLKCVKGVALTQAIEGPELVSVGEQSKEDALGVAILEIVAANNGRAISPEEVKKNLPDRFVTSVAQIKSIAKNIPEIEIFGPGFLRFK